MVGTVMETMVRGERTFSMAADSMYQDLVEKTGQSSLI